MKLFSEKVTPTFTNSSFNILRVEKFSEIFFDVYEIELNKIKYPVEKISSHNGNPVVSVPVVIGQKEQNYPFVLIQGEYGVFFNEANTFISDDADAILAEHVNQSSIFEDEPDDDLNFPLVEFDDGIIEEHIQSDILEKIENAKADAIKRVEIIKEQKLKEADADIQERSKVLEKTVQDAKSKLVEEFVEISNQLKNEIFNASDEKYSEISKTIDNKISDISDELTKSINENFSNSAESFESSIRDFVKHLYETSVLPDVRSSLVDISENVVDKLKGIENDLNLKLEEKADVEFIQNISAELETLRNEHIVLNDNLKKGVNKALSRVGNVANRVDSVASDISDVASQINEKIENSANKISEYYSEKLKSLEEQTIELTERSRKYLTDLVNESKNTLLDKINGIQKEAPIEYVIESKGKKEKKSFDSIERDIDKKISDKISDEVVRFKKYIAVYSSGGGSVAQQFANGGTMNGDLTVTGAISASSYLGIPNPDLTQYLPISGGVINGNLTVTGTLSTTLLEALSANITVIDIKQYELSGFNVQGNATVQGSISASGNLSAANIYSNNLTTNSSAIIGGDLTVDTNTLFVDSFNNRVGVGTSTPLAKLDVNGPVNIGSNFTPYTGVYGIVVNDISGGIILNRIGAANEPFIRLTTDGLGGFQLRGLTAGGVRLTDINGSNEWVRVTNTGNLGIGNTTPNEKLTVSGNISATDNIVSRRVGINNSAVLPANVTLGVGPNIINDANLPVQYSSTTSINYIGLNAQSTGYGGLIGYTQTEFGGGLVLRTVPAAAIRFVTDNTQQRMVILPTSGNVGIGASTPNEKLTVAGNISATGTVTGSNLVYTSTDQTIAGAKTFTNNIVGNGTANRLPNQTTQAGLTDDSIITRKSLRSLIGYQSKDMLRGAWAQEAATGSNGRSQNVYALMLQAANTSLSGAITMTARNPAGVGGPEPIIGDVAPSSYGGISFASPIVMNLSVRSGGGSGWTSLTGQSAAVALGSWDNAVTSDITSLYQTNTNLNRGYVTILFRNGSVSVVTQYNNNPVVTSALDTYTLPNFKKDYSVVVENGYVYLYSGSTLLGSVSGAPTGSAVLGGFGGLFANHSSTTTAPINQFRFYIDNLNITWG